MQHNTSLFAHGLCNDAKAKLMTNQLRSVEIMKNEL